jgi:hypothetical protein
MREDEQPGDDGPDPEDEAELDEAFPLGDGTADVEGMVWCPYCGEANEVSLDPGSGAVQQYDEDCQVCCRPWRVTVRYRGDGSADVRVEGADGGDGW